MAFTTGILVGIGEDWRDRTESLLAIRELHERYNHIQEIIIRPVVENERWQNDSPDLETIRRVTAMARVAISSTVTSTISAVSRRSPLITSIPSTNGRTPGS